MRRKGLRKVVNAGKRFLDVHGTSILWLWEFRSLARSAEPTSKLL